MPPKRMTANPVKPARYRPGKPVAADASESESEEASEEEETQQQPAVPQPKASSFPKDASKITSNLKNVDLNERRRQAAAQEAVRLAQEKAARAQAEAEFETEESEEGSEDEGSESDEEEESEEESSSEDDVAARRKLLRPVFIKKDQRGPPATNPAAARSEPDKQAEEEARRKAKADALVREQLEKSAAARAAGKKFWDDEDLADIDDVDDTDGLDPAAEYAAWKLRELQRIKRDREALIAAEKEREEVERRRNLSAAEREAEDRAYLEAQKQEREGRGKMGYLQRYHHRGAFFQDDARAAGLDRRDIMGARFQDEVDREVLPQYMQIRDMTKLGRKGRTRYKDLRSEDTGRWGDFGERRGGGRGGEFGGDERFRPDRGREGATGANASMVGERKRVGDDREREGKRARVE